MNEFYLAGHSFGGYLAGNYALKYPQYVKKLLLLSPIGIRVPDQNETWEERMGRRRQSGNGPPKWVEGAVGFVWA